MSDQRQHTPWQQKVFSKLIELQFRVVYRKGSENRVADALSRRPHADSTVMAISSSQPLWLEEIQSAYDVDPRATELLQKLILAPDSEPHYTLRDGVIRYDNRIWIPAVPELQAKIVQALHSSSAGGHSGIPVTLRRLHQLFYWKRMKTTVRSFVQECVICQRAKHDRSKYPGLLQPLPVPDMAWQMVSLDFIEGLRKSGRFNCILVVVDKFSRYAHFIGLHHPFTAQTVAVAYMDNVYKLHGLPESIISDRDKVFTSKFWTELFRRSDTQLRMSSSYHPQTDGQTERVNQCLEAYLRCFSHSCPTKWSEWLSLVEYWYNTSLHSALGKSPFEVLYGRAPRQLGITVNDACPVTDLDAWLAERDLMVRLLQQHLHRVQQRMKAQADKNMTERSFFGRGQSVPSSAAICAIICCTPSTSQVDVQVLRPILCSGTRWHSRLPFGSP